MPKSTKNYRIANNFCKKTALSQKKYTIRLNNMRLSGPYRVKKRLNSHPKRPAGKSCLHRVKAAIGPLKSSPPPKNSHGEPCGPP